MKGNVKLSIIYYSMTGTNHRMCLWAKEAAEATGAEVRLYKVPELAPQAAIDSTPAWKEFVQRTADVPEVTAEDLDWPDAILFSTPTRFGNVASQMKQFLDTTGGIWSRGALVNKVVSAMSSANAVHGGQEQTVLQLYTSMYHWGAIIAAPGFVDPATAAAGGNPYGTTATLSDGQIVEPEKLRAAVEAQVLRLLSIAEKIKE